MCCVSCIYKPAIDMFNNVLESMKLETLQMQCNSLAQTEIQAKAFYTPSLLYYFTEPVLV